MRVPGNERAFTVSPARGIPFPQLVCIGAAAGQSQAFPVSGRRRLVPRAPGIGLRAPPPPRATVRGQGGESTASQCGGHAAALPASTYPHPHAPTFPPLETAIPVRTAAASTLVGLRGRQSVSPPAPGGCCERPRQGRPWFGDPGGGAEGRSARRDWGRALSRKWSGIRVCRRSIREPWR